METELLNAACFIWMIVLTCCIIKLLYMVRNMQAPGNQGTIKETARTVHDYNALETAREPTPRRSGALERMEHHGNTTAGGVTARRRHPQEQDERFS